jgi:serine/threonine-protein kinase
VALLPEGTVVGNYRVEKLLGRGGMGVVYQARDLRLDRLVALKLLSGETAQDVGFRARFLRESHAAASIDHPNVLPVYEAAEVDGELYIAMRLVGGEDLGSLLSREGPLDAARAVGLIAQVADALDAVHAHGLVHRDVKPSNILVHTEGAREHAYLTDFGITKVSSDQTPLTKTGAFVGTVDYCPPELIRGGTLDARADEYALGCVLFECLTGARPFPRDSELSVIYAHLEDPPPSARDRRPELPAALDAVLARSMAKEREERFASTGEMATAALATMGMTHRPVAAAPASRQPPRLGARRPQARRRTLAIAAALAALAAAVVAAVVLTGGGGEAAWALPPANAKFDYQIGGDYALPSGVEVVSRDWFSGSADPDAYSICIVNAFQAQDDDEEVDRPDERSSWPAGLVLRELGDDPNYGGEYLIDISAAANRARAADWVQQMIKTCADKGFDAVEFDSLDSWTAFDGTPLEERVPFGQEEAVRYAEALADRAHALGLAVAQKNTPQLSREESRERIGFDFAIADQCGRFNECHEYSPLFGDRVFAIEYRRSDFTRACRAIGRTSSVVLRDSEVSQPGSSGYRYAAC